MTATISNRRKALSALLAAGSLALVLTPGAAFAKGRDDGTGFGAAAIAGGIALAALAAAAASSREEDLKRTEKRVVTEGYGKNFVQRMRVGD